MILFPQMAPSGTNRCASNCSYLVEQVDPQSGARSPPVEGPGRPSKRELPHSTTGIRGGTEDLFHKSGKESVVDLAESPITSQPRTSRAVSYLRTIKGFTSR